MSPCPPPTRYCDHPSAVRSTLASNGSYRIAYITIAYVACPHSAHSSPSRCDIAIAYRNITYRFPWPLACHRCNIAIASQPFNLPLHDPMARIHPFLFFPILIAPIVKIMNLSSKVLFPIKGVKRLFSHIFIRCPRALHEQRANITSLAFSIASDQKSSGQRARSLKCICHYIVFLLLFDSVRASAERLSSSQKRK